MTSMPEVRLDSDTSQHTEQVIVGVDTHKDTHVASVITLVGVLVDSRAFPASAAGYRRLLAWARSLGAVRRAGVEGTGSYGAALARYGRQEGIAVVEVNRPDRAARRRRVRLTRSTRRPPPAPS
jgi:transposase